MDIWDASDQFRFVYQTLNGDGEIIARVDNLENTDGWAKAGIMIREDLAGDAPNVLVATTPGNGTTFQWRATRGGDSASTAGFAGPARKWVRLVRSGNTFTGYYSANGTAWTLLRTTAVSMPSQVYIGLAVTSHNPSATATAAFSNVIVTGPFTTQSQISTTTTPANDTGLQSSPLIRPEAPSRSRVIVSMAGDYDGDGKADLATYLPATGEWHVVMSGANYATGIVTRWGTATDLPVSGDYDGDRRTDIAYYRPSTGIWSILTSSTNYTKHVDVLLGAQGDMPVPGDFDGDRLTDLAVYSPATGQWRIVTSTSQYTAEIVIGFGGAGDCPVPGDYDGDGKTDPAVYRPSTGEWRILQSSTNYATNVTIVLGTSSDVLVPADYDGDGVTDIAVYEPSTGRWQVQLSSHHFKTIVIARLGGVTDVPAPLDYDGDGKADVAVVHRGAWQILYTTAGYASYLSVASAGDADVPLTTRP
jgi:regulation of enolase protein 1 (concanavalin A-like superfamily)